MKRKVILLVIVALVIPVIYSFLTNQVDRYKDVFGVSLPTNMKKVYSVSTKDNWMGEGIFYEIYQLNKDTQFDISNYEKDENQVFELRIKELITLLNIEDKFYPEYNSQNVYTKVKRNQDELILMYNPSSCQLITIIEIS